MNPATTIRKAAVGDQSRILALLRVLAGEASGKFDDAGDVFTALLTGERGQILVAVDGGVVVGVITFSFNLAMRYSGEYAQVEELIVDDSQRGKGTGALLVRAAIDAARDRNCSEIGLYALETTRAFYEKIGFVYAGPEVRMDLTK